MTLFTLPTSRRITQDWGQDFKTLNGVTYPNGFYASIGWLGHNGIDYGCPVGDPVESVCDGVVEYVGAGNNHPLLSGGGSVVLIRNDELQMRFEYLHLSQQNVYTGQHVKRGQVIALSGNTGVSSGAHLHVGAIPVRANVNNGYRGRVDLTQWLYGPSNPDYAGGGLAAQGAVTPTVEGFLMALSDQDQAELLANVRKLVTASEVEKDFDAKVNEKVDELVNNARKTFWNTEESKIRLQNAEPAQVAAQIDAAGLASSVRDELVKLLSA